jgi:hypothetical protein
MDPSGSGWNRSRPACVRQHVRRRLLFRSIVVTLSISSLAAACGAEPAAEDSTSPPVTAPPDTTTDPLDLSPADRATILGVVAAERFTVDNSFGGQAFSQTLLVVDVLGEVDASGFVTDDGAPLDEFERNAITSSLPGIEVRFVSPDEAHQHQAAAMAGDTTGTAGTADPVLQLAAPAVIDGQLTVTSSLWCGSLCAIGGAHVVERQDDGTWLVTGTTGPSWIS